LSKKRKKQDAVQVNGGMTGAEQWMQKQAQAADFVKSVFPDQMDGLDDHKQLNK